MSSARSNKHNNNNNGYGGQFRSQDVSMSIQKKLFNRMVANKTMIKTLIDHDSARLMDNLHRLCKLYCKDETWNPFAVNWANGQAPSKLSAKEMADKVVKYLIKITMKVAILTMNQQLNEEEMHQVSQIQRNIRSILMTIVSFHQIDFSYERSYLISQMKFCRDSLKQLIKSHLSDKSLARVDFFFDFLSGPEFLDRFFTTTEPSDSLYEVKTLIMENINHLLENKLW